MPVLCRCKGRYAVRRITEAIIAVAALPVGLLLAQPSVAANWTGSATWSASGRGSFERSQGSQTLSARWERSVPGVSTKISGRKTESPVGSFGPMQPGGSKVQVKCSWDFRR